MKYFASVLIFILLWMGSVAQQKYELAEENVYASCVDYKLVDSSGATLTVPKSVKEGLLCPSLLSLDGDTLCYRSGNSIRIFHISSGLDYKLFDVFDDVDGVSGPVWSPSHRRIGFIIINQQRSHGYNDFCRIIILDLNSDFKVIGKHKFDRPVNFSCGSICSSDAGTDFRFLDENNFEYTRNINIDERPGEKGFVFIEN
ncbi:MAG TPA: hypothetical protein DEP77_13625 [Bacteroidales bacterium]|nr:hypothetical protein [Bacteroidales bacterium]